MTYMIYSKNRVLLYFLHFMEKGFQKSYVSHLHVEFPYLLQIKGVAEN